LPSKNKPVTLYAMICGLDEAGRGPLAGPVTAAAVILGENFPRGVLDDSKRLSPARREKAAALIKERALAWAIGWADHTEIDRLNILRASLLAMRRAFEHLELIPDQVLADGLFCPEIPAPCSAIVRGDCLIPEIMAASILAKTARDAWMVAYDKGDPRWQFARHKGYPTSLHRLLLARHGPSEIHRRSFALFPRSS
jgi:ribonuclease HII